jgi:predicted alpha/beta superfamily hydrolase
MSACLFSLWLTVWAQAQTTPIEFIIHTNQPVLPEAGLYLSGSTQSLGNWQPTGFALTRSSDSCFEGTIELAIGENIEFKVTRGSWDTVEKNLAGQEIANRTLTVTKGAKVVITVESWADQYAGLGRSSVVGKLELRRIESIEPTRLIRVWLPEGYHESDQSYPVLYMLDGQNVFDHSTSAVGQEWGVDETLTELIQSKVVKPLIVVAIDNSSRRIDEYTPMPDGEGQRQRGGGAADFTTWIVRELKPQIDREYRTQARRESTWIGGSSLGGLCAMYSILQHNQTFGAAIAMSPSLQWANEGMFGWIDQRLTNEIKPTRIWIDFGGQEGQTEKHSQEYVERFQRFQNSLKLLAEKNSGNVKIDGRVFRGVKHNESAWRARFHEAIKFITD